MVYEKITGEIIAAAIKAHKELGPGFLESIYENALMHELLKRGFDVKQQFEIAVFYDEIEIGKHRLDILVNNLIVVELKAIKAIEQVHFAIVKSYLRALGKEHGLILNFNNTVLEVKRVLASRS
ncbi:MAG: GxxExxY protein [Spirochaetales bacterium]|nr:GxxExxY protein [Spirochaetales bacterium]